MISTFNAKKASFATNVAVVKRVFQDVLEMPIRLVPETIISVSNPRAINWCFLVSIGAPLQPTRFVNALGIATTVRFQNGLSCCVEMLLTLPIFKYV